MNFKSWIAENWDFDDDFDDYGADPYDALDAQADMHFGGKTANAMMDFNDILVKLQLPPVRIPPEPINNTGSLATIYPNPHQKGTVIKVTADIQDIKNIEKAQKLRSSNIVRMHRSAYLTGSTAAAVLDFVQGNEVPLSAGEIMALAENGYAQAAEDVLSPNQLQAQVLRRYKMNNKRQRAKWSEMFATLARLEGIGIPLDDLADNIIDAGQHFVLIDLGL